MPEDGGVAGYVLVGEPPGRELAVFADALQAALGRAGFEHDAAAPLLVLGLVDDSVPAPFRRPKPTTFVAAIQAREPDVSSLDHTYPQLLRVLADVLLTYVPGEGVWFTTMERGHYVVRSADGLDALADRTVDRLLPLATARKVTDNEFRRDLEPELWGGDELVEELRRAGVRLGQLGLLPPPFPLENALDAGRLRALEQLYGVSGISYGNLSARKDARRFWMSASGVDKTRLDVPGRDVLLVTGYDEAQARIVVSLPPDVEPRRVSVDAIEHWTIYREHPGVGAIVHVHAWKDGVAATTVNYPAGTEELARAVSALLAAEPDPSCAVVGLKNHGITATGPSLTEIVDRIGPTLSRRVPMG